MFRPQDENFVSALLRYFHLPLRRFPGVQYLACCSATSGVDLPGKAKTACFSRACVNRRFPVPAVAAATCAIADGNANASAAGVTSAAPSDELRAAARRTIEGATPISGKYRSEVEVAVQHALAYHLPGTRYRIQEGIEAMATCHPRKVMRKKLAAANVGIACTHVALAVPQRHALGFRAMHTLLKRRAFRGESDEIAWIARDP